MQKKRLAYRVKKINEATGTQMCSHWFSSSQWKLPTKAQYEALQKLFNDNDSNLLRSHDELTEEYSKLNRTYSELILDYDDLKKQYENLRRPFSVSAKVNYTDVWDYDSVQYYEGKHPCEKPRSLIRDIVKASSRPGMVVLDPFLGSGKAIAHACLDLDCKLIGVEMDPDIYSSTLGDLLKYEKNI